MSSNPFPLIEQNITQKQSWRDLRYNVGQGVSGILRWKRLQEVMQSYPSSLDRNFLDKEYIMLSILLNKVILRSLLEMDSILLVIYRKVYPYLLLQEQTQHNSNYIKASPRRKTPGFFPLPFPKISSIPIFIISVVFPSELFLFSQVPQ